MKKRIKINFVLLSITIPVILISQIYWIISAYNINQLQVEKDINQCLENTINKENSIRINSITKIEKGTKNHIVINSTYLKDTVNIDSIINTYKNQNNINQKIITFDFNSEKFPESLQKNNISGKLNIDLQSIILSLLSDELSKSEPYNINRLDSLFEIELSKRGIKTPYELQIKKDSSQFSPVSSELSSRIIPLTFLQTHYIRALITNSRQIVLSRMTKVLIASILLITIAIWSFFYMLRIILKQKKLSEVKNDFINNMTHELKTPISTVSAAIEAISNFGVLNNRQKTLEYLKLSQTELKNLSGLIEKVLIVSRLEQDKIELKKENISVQTIIEKIIKRHSTANEKNIEFKLDAECEDFSVYADRMHFESIINNLTDNAIKYCKKNIQIHYSCYSDRDFKYITVADNGFGISKEHQKYIFDKFYRIPRGDIHDVKGFGLGLHYVKNIMNQHKGSVSIDSTEGKGSKFILKFPHYGNKGIIS